MKPTAAQDRSGPGRRRLLAPAVGGLAMLLAAAGVLPATLPPHQPLRILVVSDEVNPHGLADWELTQPGDISAALLVAGNGLGLDPAPDSVVEIPTNQIEQATQLLQAAPCDPARYHAVVYFSHRIPDNGNDPVGRQAAFTAAVDAYLRSGGGLVAFHHGSYFAPGKEGILDLIGATATGAVPWNTVEGQNVIAVAPGHFVSTQGLSYPGIVAYADPGRGVPAGSYPYFNNTPDERYPAFEINPAAGQVEILFASDYADNGGTHLLGFTHRRPGWAGMVVGYQPAEYQPNALDVAGPNFQILANAIVFAAGARLQPPPDAIVLRMARGAAAGEVELSWTGGQPAFSVFRSPDPAGVLLPASGLGSACGRSWTDAAPAASLLHYQVAGH